MCGIVGYIGQKEASPFLIEGLRRLEYRGYDSAGVAVVAPSGSLSVTKSRGRVDGLANVPRGTAGIGHTRWATHGSPTDANAHPHIGGDGSVALVHNGIIENYYEIKNELERDGYKFRSETDTETAAHYIDRELARSRPDTAERVCEAVAAALRHTHGSYAIAMLIRDFPDLLIAACSGSPLVIGANESEYMAASDPLAIAGLADRILYLDDREIIGITREEIRTLSLESEQPSSRQSALRPVRSVRFQPLSIAADAASMQGYSHYMLKEIHEQPSVIRTALHDRLSVAEGTTTFEDIPMLNSGYASSIKRIIITGCGTSWHAALVGEHVIESFARIPVEVQYASELRYRDEPVGEETLLIAISQSGETADTLAAVRELRQKGIPAIAICNAEESSLAREADITIPLRAGPEIGVASTKAFTAQCTVLTMLALSLARMRSVINQQDGREIAKHLASTPNAIADALAMTSSSARHIAEQYAECRNALFLGRLYNFPTALEGALKLKEISYIHAEGYPAAEMKHGPIALVDSHTPSVFVMPRDSMHEKILANMEEIKARNGPVIAVLNERDEHAASLADAVMHIPQAPDFLQPIIAVVPLQLLAYHAAVARGCDVDKPRNLAKSVTVE